MFIIVNITCFLQVSQSWTALTKFYLKLMIMQLTVLKKWKLLLPSRGVLAGIVFIHISLTGSCYPWCLSLSNSIAIVCCLPYPPYQNQIYLRIFIFVYFNEFTWVFTFLIRNYACYKNKNICLITFVKNCIIEMM